MSTVNTDKVNNNKDKISFEQRSQEFKGLYKLYTRKSKGLIFC